jgi:hypothetical protein
MDVGQPEAIPTAELLLRSRLVGSDRDCSRLTGISEVIHLAEKRAFCRSFRFGCHLRNSKISTIDSPTKPFLRDSGTLGNPALPCGSPLQGLPICACCARSLQFLCPLLAPAPFRGFDCRAITPAAPRAQATFLSRTPEKIALASEAPPESRGIRMLDETNEKCDCVPACAHDGLITYRIRSSQAEISLLIPCCARPFRDA